MNSVFCSFSDLGENEVKYHIDSQKATIVEIKRFHITGFLANNTRFAKDLVNGVVLKKNFGASLPEPIS